MVDDRFTFERGNQNDLGSVLGREAAFWDQEEAAQEQLYEEPHDWAFDVDLANVIQSTVFRFLVRVSRRMGEVKTVLDLGCGSGIYSRLMAVHKGMRITGIDLSPAKVAKARKLADDAGVGDLVSYQVGNLLDYTAPAPVDMICAFGVLHHLPDVEQVLPALVERNLRPGGIIITVEPNFEGLAPPLLRFASWLSRSRFRKHFDFERHEKLATAVQAGTTIRGESPAGLAFHRESFVLDRWLQATYEPVLIGYANVVAPFFANAFVVYQKSPRVRRFARWLLPLVVRVDRFLCRFSRFRRYAALGMYAMKRR